MLLQWKRARGGYYICTALWLTTCLVHWQEQTVEFIASIPFFIGPFHVIYLQVDKDHLNAPWNKWWAHTGLWWGVIVSWSRSLKWNTALTVCPSENSSGLVFLTSSKTKRYLYPPKNTQPLCHLFPLQKKKPTTPCSCLSAEPQSNILWVLISWVFSLMPLFYSVFTLTLVLLVWATSTDILTKTGNQRWTRRKQEEKTHRAQILGWNAGLNFLTGLVGSVFFKMSGNLHPLTPPPLTSLGLFSFPLSGLQWGIVENWLYNKEKRIMHICWYTVLFVLSFCLCMLIWGAYGAECLFSLSASPQLTLHVRTDNVNVQFHSFVFLFISKCCKF